MKDGNLLSKEALRSRGLLEVISYSGRCCVDIPGVKHIAKGMVWAIDEISRLVGNKGVRISYDRKRKRSGTRSLVLICHDPDVPSRGDDVN